MNSISNGLAVAFPVLFTLPLMPLLVSLLGRALAVLPHDGTLLLVWLADGLDEGQLNRVVYRARRRLIRIKVEDRLEYGG